MMLVDYTTVLDRPSVSVEGPTQQGIESIVEVTPASSVTSDGSSDPCCGSNFHRRRRHLRQGLFQQPGCPVVVQGASLAEVQGRAAS
jgi:hypothetical protein